METLIQNNLIINDCDVSQESKGSFIEANTEKVSIEHLKNDCVIPVFSKDNETTVSHFEFINTIREVVTQIYPESIILRPDIRVSHVIKGRTPSAIGKPVKELLEHEKTIYYERMAFMIEIPEINKIVEGNKVSLTIGGVRAYNQENLYGKKAKEKFKIFIGFKNLACCNLCLSTDGFSNEIKVLSISELRENAFTLFDSYSFDNHLNQLIKLKDLRLSENQFANLMGRLKMYSYLSDEEKKGIIAVDINDSHINSVVKNYYQDPHFSGFSTKEINLWKLYNLLTGANKSSYIDNSLERNINYFELTNNLALSIENKTSNWFLN